MELFQGRLSCPLLRLLLVASFPRGDDPFLENQSGFEALVVVRPRFGKDDIAGDLAEAQLAGLLDGRLVIPVGAAADQQLITIVKNEQGELQQELSVLCRFVPLIGKEGWQA